MTLAAFRASLKSQAYRDRMARILDEIDANPDVAVGHCGSYG